MQQQEATQRDRLTALQSEMNVLATKIDQAQNAYDATKGEMVQTQQALEATRAKYASLRARLDERARLTYEMGPASSLGVILGSSNVGELSDRLEFVDQLSALDADLAVEVQNHANDLAAEKAQLQDIQARQAAALEDLGNQQTQLNAKFGEAQSIYEDLAAKAQDAADTEASLRSSADQADALITQLEKKLKAEQLAAARAAAAAAREAARKAAQAEKQRGSSNSSSSRAGAIPAAGRPAAARPAAAPPAADDRRHGGRTAVLGVPGGRAQGVRRLVRRSPLRRGVPPARRERHPRAPGNADPGHVRRHGLGRPERAGRQLGDRDRVAGVDLQRAHGELRDPRQRERRDDHRLRREHRRRGRAGRRTTTSSGTRT